MRRKLSLFGYSAVIAITLSNSSIGLPPGIAVHDELRWPPSVGQLDGENNILPPGGLPSIRGELGMLPPGGLSSILPPGAL